MLSIIDRSRIKLVMRKLGNVLFVDSDKYESKKAQEKLIKLAIELLEDIQPYGLVKKKLADVFCINPIIVKDNS